MWSYVVLLFASVAVIAGQNTTTVAPITTTTSTTTPSTTTVHTTTTAKPNTTTVAPSSTTTVAPSTTPAPPGPPRNSYNVTSPNGTVCIIMEAVMQLKVSYLSQNKSKVAVVPFDEHAAVDTSLSTCHGVNNTQVLAINFAGQDTIVFTFKNSSTVFVSDIAVNYTQDKKYFPDSDQPGQKDSVHSGQLFLFSVLPGKSYLCSRDGPLTLSDNVTVDLVSVQLQAFHTETSHPGQFGDATECSTGDISNIIPIAVGVALAALVVIVLISYMIGRRRSRQKGYQSV